MIQVRKLNKQYDAGMVHALKDVSLVIAKGEVCSIMGPSGCGKSTLLNMIGALDSPSSGEIIINGCSLESLSPAKYRNDTVGFIFQLHHLLPNITLLENVSLPLIPRREIPQRQRMNMAMELLDEVGLTHRATFYPVQISVGERQRVAFARALVNHPVILLADEPTGSVDSCTAKVIMDAILRRCEKENMTTLIVTHNPEIAKRTARVMCMRDGWLNKDSGVI